MKKTHDIVCLFTGGNSRCLRSYVLFGADDSISCGMVLSALRNDTIHICVNDSAAVPYQAAMT